MDDCNASPLLEKVIQVYAQLIVSHHDHYLPCTVAFYNTFSL